MLGKKQEEGRDVHLITTVTQRNSSFAGKSYSTRVVIAGKIVEIYKYDNTQYKRPGAAQKPGSGELASTPEQRAEYTRLNNARAKRRLRRLVNSNIGRGPHRDCFLTLTFRDNISDIDTANDYFQDFAKRLKYYLGEHELRYISVLERQQRGAVHYHVCLFSFPYLRAEKISELWGHGYIKINTLSQIADIGSYMAKYLSKADSDKDTKKYWSSRNLVKPTIFIDTSAVAKRALDILENSQKKVLYFFTFLTRNGDLVSYTKYSLEDYIDISVIRTDLTLQAAI